MRFLSLVAILLCFQLTARSQNEGGAEKGLLFPKFITGTVKMKTGETSSLPLNYDMINLAINYLENGQVMTISNPDDVDTVTINSAAFIPVNQKFYHVLLQAKMPLLASYKAKVTHLVTTAGKEGSNKEDQDEVSNTVSDAYVNKRFQQNKAYSFGAEYWIRNGQVMNKIYNAKQLARLFPKSSDQILAFCRDKKIDFSKEEDVISAFNFATTGVN